MNIELITLTDTEQWVNLLKRFPEALLHAGLTPQWYRFYEGRGLGKACCVVAQEPEGTILYPFLMNKVPDWFSEREANYYDIQGAPGYNGLITNNSTPVFLEAFHFSFGSWCKNQNIIAEFSRCDPVSENHKFFPQACLTEVNRNIIVDLSKDLENMEGYHRSAMKNIRKANREGLEVRVFSADMMDEGLLKQFSRIYTETMRRNDAMAEYLHPEGFFAEACKVTGDLLVFAFVFYQDQAIASEAVVASHGVAWSWLGGTLAEYFPLRPNDLLKHEIICYLKNKKLRNFCLGGGIAPGDGVFTYKKTFATYGEVPFYVLKRVHNHAVYASLMSHWRVRNPHLVSRVGNRLLAYREQC